MCDLPHTPEIILLAVLLLTVGGSRVRPVMCLLCSNGRYSAMTNNWLLLWTALWILPQSVPRQRRAGDTILTHRVSQLFRVLRQSWADALTEKEMMKWWTWQLMEKHVGGNSGGVWSGSVRVDMFGSNFWKWLAIYLSIHPSVQYILGLSKSTLRVHAGCLSSANSSRTAPASFWRPC